ncbi:MAG: hypothetical protein IJ506_07580 [Clostridia bacterium]|nr:hypothetical protein [Clostridia bacterium]
MAKEVITVQCYPSVEAVNTKTSERAKFGWELTGNQSVDDGEYYYQMLTFERDKGAVWYPQICQLEKEYDELQKVLEKDNPNEMEKLIPRYKGKQYYEDTKDHLKKPAEVKSPDIKDTREIAKRRNKTILFTLLTALGIFLCIFGSPSLSFFPFITFITTIVQLIGYKQIVKAEKGKLTGKEAVEAVKKYQKYQSAFKFYHDLLYVVLSSRTDEITEEAKNLINA